MVALTHYGGTSWQTVSAGSLSGLNFSSIAAQSGDDVWLSAWSDSQAPYLLHLLLHLSGGQWTQIGSPWPEIAFDAVAPDGQGGVWATAYDDASSGDPMGPWVVHLSASGQWSQVAFPSADYQSVLALVPGGGPVVGAGSIFTKPGRLYECFGCSLSSLGLGLRCLSKATASAWLSP